MDLRPQWAAPSGNPAPCVRDTLTARTVAQDIVVLHKRSVPPRVMAGSTPRHAWPGGGSGWLYRLRVTAQCGGDLIPVGVQVGHLDTDTQTTMKPSDPSVKGMQRLGLG